MWTEQTGGGAGGEGRTDRLLITNVTMLFLALTLPLASLFPGKLCTASPPAGFSGPPAQALAGPQTPFHLLFP